MATEVAEPRGDVVYAWDACEFIFNARGVESRDVEIAYNNGAFPKLWRPLSVHEHTVRFRVVGPPSHRDAAIIRAWLNLMAKERARNE